MPTLLSLSQICQKEKLDVVRVRVKKHRQLISLFLNIDQIKNMIGFIVVVGAGTKNGKIL